MRMGFLMVIIPVIILAGVSCSKPAVPPSKKTPPPGAVQSGKRSLPSSNNTRDVSGGNDSNNEVFTKKSSIKTNADIEAALKQLDSSSFADEPAASDADIDNF